MPHKKSRLDPKILKIKRGFVFVSGLAFFLFPGQNEILVGQTLSRPPEVRGIMAPFPTFDYPVNFTGLEPPLLTARTIAVVDRDSMVKILGKNEQVPALPASTVKIMTGLVALENYKLDDYVMIGETNNYGQTMGLVPREVISIKNLLYGLLVASANDAAVALANHFPQGQEAFIKAMNEKAQELNLKDTYFANSTGLDSNEENHLLRDFSYTTAVDLARLSAFAMKNEEFATVVGTKSVEVTDMSGRLKHPLYNVNQLLGNVYGMRGVKTGWTQDAGECLVSFTERNGRGIISVVLGSQDRFGETEKLVNWVFSNYRWEDVTPTI